MKKIIIHLLSAQLIFSAQKASELSSRAKERAIAHLEELLPVRDIRNIVRDYLPEDFYREKEPLSKKELEELFMQDMLPVLQEDVPEKALREIVAAVFK